MWISHEHKIGLISMANYNPSGFELKLWYTCVLAFNIIFSADTVFADEYHHNNMLIGDRASGMAGAYVAIADDPVGLYYNPAGVVYSPNSNLSASMNALHITTTVYKDVIGSENWVRTSVNLLPNYFGVTQPLGHGTLGFSYAVTDSILEDQDQVFLNIPGPGDTFTINFNNQETVYNIGPSYSLKLAKNTSVGVTLYGYVRMLEQIMNQMLDLKSQFLPEWTAQEYQQINTYKHEEELGIKPIIGIMHSPFPKLSLGIKYSQVFVTYGKQESYSNCYTSLNLTEQTLCQQNALVSVHGAGRYTLTEPWNIDLGAAYFADTKSVFSASISIWGPKYGLTEPLVNTAFGAEYYISSRWALRFGLFTNFANTPLIQKGVAKQKEHIDLYGGTFSFSHFTRSSSLTIGFAGSGGIGEA